MGKIGKDIKILEDYIELIKKGYCEDCNELCNIYGTPTYPAKKISEATEHLIKAYKELEEDNKQLKTRRIIGSIYDVKIEDLKDVLSPYYIPKSVIKEKIDKKQKQLELLKKELQGRQTNFVNKNIITGQIQVLQELLEKRK